MKYTQSAVFLFAASLIVQQASCVGAVELEPTFQQKHASKNIAFFAPFGGASHMSWVLNIGNELGMRGHNFTFLTVVRCLQSFFCIFCILIYPLFFFSGRIHKVGQIKSLCKYN